MAKLEGAKLLSWKWGRPDAEPMLGTKQFFRVEAQDTYGGRTSFPALPTLGEAQSKMIEYKQKYPNLSDWEILWFEPIYRVTKGRWV
jgi:hypothetical protein